ncbi:SIS domain-containing protein [Azospirillum rugosum]|nr:glucosamine--fructose-6-phosphate aminotransferase (isomerizing) [Azospirillum rugosum]
MTDSETPQHPGALMRAESLSAPDRIAAQLRANGQAYADLATLLRARPPAFAVTVARGSSGHAAAYARALFETSLGVVTAPAAPSAVTLYGARLRLKDSLVLAISQSGESPDLVTVVERARDDGALTLALVNELDSPLARAAERCLPLHAGPECSVAATKSFLCSLSAAASLVAAWRPDAELATALTALPDRLRAAAACDWSAALPILRDARSLLVVGRGYGFPVAQEMATKLKETCTLHAEALSAADLLHGPVALVHDGFPVLLVALPDATLPGVLELARRLRGQGAHLMVASPVAEALDLAHTALPLPAPLHPMLDPMMAAQAFYPLAADTALARGLDPDRPPSLSKVTRTV